METADKNQNAGQINYFVSMASHISQALNLRIFILGFRQSTFLCTTLKCIEKIRIPFIKSGIPASNLGSSEARNPAKFAACQYINNILDTSQFYCMSLVITLYTFLGKIVFSLGFFLSLGGHG